MTFSGTVSVVQTDPGWRELPWLIHGFSLRTGGVTKVYGGSDRGELNLGFTKEDRREDVQRNRAILRDALNVPEDMRLVTVRQVHSSIVHRVDTSECMVQACDGDGLMTDRPGLLLGILTADCVPILVVDRKRRCVGAFHAGWRGTAGSIAESGVRAMCAEYGSVAEDLMALIGPGIGACCYAVGEEVEGAFEAGFRYGAELVSDGEDGARRLDLIEANRRQLQDAGLGKGAIRQAGGCTQCNPALYFSYRGEGGVTGRMMSVIGMRQGE